MELTDLLAQRYGIKVVKALVRATKGATKGFRSRNIPRTRLTYQLTSSSNLYTRASSKGLQTIKMFLRIYIWLTLYQFSEG